MFSFASVAVALWLGIVAVACLYQVWRAVTNHSNLYGNRDYQRGTRGENTRDYRHLNPAAEGLIPIACRSVAAWNGSGKRWAVLGSFMVR